jgi:DNA-binding beta-propeller fold protein YncE
MRVAAALLAILVTTLGGASAAAGQGSFEVWTIDQSNTPGTASGGTLYVYEGPSLAGAAASSATPERIDLGGAAEELCLERTGTAPVRPHMLAFDPSERYGIVAYVATGHVLFLDADTRAPVECIDAGAQAHAAFSTPDGRSVIVANQNGKLLQRISADFETGTFTLDPAATLNLATCVTPSGAPCEAPGLRPDNAPICPVSDSSSRFVFVTLRGGGLFVVDPQATPLRIVAEYDRDTVHPNGCGGVEANGKMYVNSGGGTPANLTELDLYAFRLADFSTSPSPPNTPEPLVVLSDDASEDGDAHGMVLTKHGRYLWMGDRGGSRMLVVDTTTDELVGEFALPEQSAPDLFGAAPSGNRIFASLRGSVPLTGDPHVSMGSTPGVGVLRVEQGGRTGTFQAIARIANVDPAGVDRADPHAIAVRGG